MNTTIKKAITVMMMVSLVTSQVACAGKVTKISKPIDEIQFVQNHTYDLRLKNVAEIKNLEASDIQKNKNELIIQHKKQTKTIMNEDIYLIQEQNKTPSGTKALSGLKTGALIGFLLVGLPAGGIAGSFNECGTESSYECNSNSGKFAEGFFQGLLIGGAIGGITGGLIGMGIGSTMPKYEKIQITPIINPTKISGTDMGVNVGVKF